MKSLYCSLHQGKAPFLCLVTLLSATCSLLIPQAVQEQTSIEKSAQLLTPQSEASTNTTIKIARAKPVVNLPILKPVQRKRVVEPMVAYGGEKTGTKTSDVIFYKLDGFEKIVVARNDEKSIKGNNHGLVRKLVSV